MKYQIQIRSLEHYLVHIILNTVVPLSLMEQVACYLCILTQVTYATSVVNILILNFMHN